MDVVVVGAGPAGSVTAIELARRGVGTMVVERREFPRFHIGESLTGQAGALLRGLGLEGSMTAAAHPVKRGVKVYGPDGNNSFWVPVVRVTKEGGREPSTTWQVRRSDFDHMLLEHAESLGVTRLCGDATRVLVGPDGEVAGVSVRTRDGETVDIRSRVVVDASGMACFLHRHGFTGPKERGRYDNQVALFTHLRGAARDPEPDRDNTIIFYQKPNHWAWFIPIDDDTVSVGVVVPAAYFAGCGESRTEFMERELSELNSELTCRVVDAEMLFEPRATSNYSYHVTPFTGPGFACVGDSHRFIDPVFSFGVHFSLHEARALAAAVADHLADPSSAGSNPFAGYEAWAEGGQGVIQDLVDAFWLEPLGFAYAVHTLHTDEMVDLFAGRVYELDESAPGLTSLRILAEQGRARAARRPAPPVEGMLEPPLAP